MAPDPTGAHVSAIYNAGYIVRENVRGGRWSSGSRLAERRREAIVRLGLVVRDAFNASDDFEALLTALVDALRQKDDPPF